MLVISGVLLTAGQLLLAFTSALPAAVPARVLVGMGDALVFSAVLALIPRWFPPRRVPLIAQGSTILGQLGQILSAVPFALLLHGAGWSVAFGTAAAGSALVAVLVLAVVRNGPGQSWQPAAAVSARQIAGQVRTVWKRPGTRLGFFGHMGPQFSMMVFALLWGGQQRVPARASGQFRCARGGSSGELSAVKVGQDPSPSGCIQDSPSSSASCSNRTIDGDSASNSIAPSASAIASWTRSNASSPARSRKVTPAMFSRIWTDPLGRRPIGPARHSSR